jgi:HAMP domain-containing protein
MLDFFKRLKIRAKLLAAFGSIILLSVILTVYAIISINDILTIKSLASEAENLSTNLVRLELASKEFMGEGYKEKLFHEKGESQHIESFNKYIAQANINLQRLSESDLLHSDESRKAQLADLANARSLSNDFHEMVELLKIRGFKDFGLEGRLREAIHSVEKSDHEFDKALMLTLRRNEKDFFLRKEIKYQSDFNASVEEFRKALFNENDTLLAGLVVNYQNSFNEVVTIEKQIGLTPKDGKRGNYFKVLEKVKADVSFIQNLVSVKAEKQITQARLLLINIFAIQLVLATILSISYANVITIVIKELRSAMARLAEGSFPKPLLVKTKEEIGETKTAFNQMLDRLKIASFAENLGNGQLHQQYSEAYRNDVLAKSLIAMQQKLIEAENEQAKINWTNEGAAQFNEIIKNESVEVTMLGDTILKQLINYLKANQGAMYLVDKDEKILQRIATYAYGKKKYIEEKLAIENGLLGQCYYERESIYLKEVPESYVKISSGLGEATPTNILITPLKAQEKVVGLIEIASFTVFEKHELAFVEKMSESIASILLSRQIAEQTTHLLEEARQREQELAQREEEMQQNAEELMATQEEMQRQRRELEREIKMLKSKLSLHEITLN